MYCDFQIYIFFLQMMPHDLPLHAGIMPRLLITIVGEPVPGADRYDQHSSCNSAVGDAF